MDNSLPSHTGNRVSISDSKLKLVLKTGWRRSHFMYQMRKFSSDESLFEFFPKISTT